MTTALTLPERARSDLSRVVIAGLLTGVSDISFATVTAMVRRGVLDPGRVFQSVASGLLGPESFNGGTSTIVLGAFLHFSIALIWTTLFVIAQRRVPLVQSIVASTGGAIGFGYVYGMFIWLAMNFIVIPLSQARVTPLNNPVFWVMLFGHGIFVGIPIVMLARDRSPVRTRVRAGARQGR